MKIVNLMCPGCGAMLNVDVDSNRATCEHCGTALPIDDEKLDGVEKAGYDFEKGHQRAQTEAVPVSFTMEQAKPPRKRKTWLWVLGWIFVFPIPLTVLMLNNPRTRGINSIIRIAIVVIGWLVYLAIGFGVGSASSGNNANSGATSELSNATVQPSASSASQDAKREGYKNIDTFVQRFNATSGMTISGTKEVDNISDKDSGHYRNEYRLGAFKNAVGTIGRIEGYGQIDIVSYGSMGYTDIRVYADVQDKVQASTMFDALANVLVSGKDKDNIPKCVKDIKEQGESSSLYLGAGYSASYGYGEVYIEARGIEFV